MRQTRKYAFVPATLAGAVALLAGCGGSGSLGEGGLEWIYPLWVATDVAIADIDGDGRNDVLTIAGLSSSAESRDGRLSVSRQTSAGTFAAPDSYVVGVYPWRMAVGDIDGDGAPDLAVTDAGRTDQQPQRTALWLLLQDGSRRGRFLAPRQLAAGSGFYHVAIADVTGDGAPDVVVDADQGLGAGASFLPQDAQRRGSFLPARPIALPGPARGVAAGNLDGDGRPDLAFWVQTSYVSYTSTGTMAIVRQLPDGSLAPAQTALASTGLNLQTIEVIDVDGDGRADAATAGFWAHAGNAADIRGRVNLFGPSGGGAFTQRQQVDMQFSVAAIAAGDLDGDGRNDLVIYGGDNECLVMIQSHTTAGTFEPPWPLR